MSWWVALIPAIAVLIQALPYLIGGYMGFELFKIILDNPVSLLSVIAGIMGAYLIYKKQLKYGMVLLIAGIIGYYLPLITNTTASIFTNPIVLIVASSLITIYYLASVKQLNKTTLKYMILGMVGAVLVTTLVSSVGDGGGPGPGFNYYEVTFECECGGIMRRVPDVFDVWFDSGVASWGTLAYPLRAEEFERLWPADFITEGHDQTRGWFYSQLGCSVVCFDRAPYKTVLMHGFTLDEHGRKMSKSLGNVVEPEEVVEKIGVDGFRLYVLSSAPWEDLRFSWEEAKNVNRMLNIIWNAVRFAYTYMSLDLPKKAFSGLNERILNIIKDNDPKLYEKILNEELEVVDAIVKHFNGLKTEDKWILSRLESFNKEAYESMEKYQLYRVVKGFFEFLVEDFSRWYIQLIRPRVWEEKDSPSKLAAYATIFRVLEKSFKIIAPFAPFLAEWVYQHVIKEFKDGEESIFLESYPKPDESLINPELEKSMKIAREIFEAVSSARQKAKRKLRWPLKKLVIETKDDEVEKAVEALKELLAFQCNVKEIEVVKEFKKELVVKPNFKVIGPILKDKVKDFVKYVKDLKEIPEVIEFEGVELKADEALIIEYKLPEGYEFSEFSKGVVYIYKELDEDLMREAYARELVRRIQEMRKELDLDVEEYINVTVDIDKNLVNGWIDYIKRETRAIKLEFGKPINGYIKEWEIEDMKVVIGIERA